MIMNHITIGVYASGKHVVNIVRPEHLEHHIEYNTTMRFGRALFVDGECKNQGYLSDEKIKEWKEKISHMNIDSSKPSETYY